MDASTPGESGQAPLRPLGFAGQGSSQATPVAPPAAQSAAPAVGRTPAVHGARFIVEIPVTRIAPNPRQPRGEFADAELDELAASLTQHGVLQPLLVVRRPLEPGEPEQFELVAGERRWRAAQRAGLSTVPCIVHDDLTERERLELALVENLQRKDLNPIEEGKAYLRLHTEFGLTHEAIAQRVGKSRPAVSNAIRLLDLPLPMQEAMAQRKINYGQGRALLAVHDLVQQQLIFEKMLKGEISAKALERMHRGRKPRRAFKDSDPELLRHERELAKVLGAPVRIKPLGPGGVIEVDFFSAEELSGIVEKLEGSTPS